jgi:VWFA-related protein
MRSSSQFVLMICLTVGAARAQPQDASAAQRLVPYTVRVPVNEVTVPFHAADFHGVPITDLILSDLRLRDNGKAPREIVSFQELHDLPVRIGLLIDASPSAAADLPRDESLARTYLSRFFDSRRDQGFVMRFDGNTQLVQDWTAAPAVLADGLRRVRHPTSIRAGTAIFDSIYRACLNQFSHQSPASANFIVLFSDGEDNLSHARIEDDAQECQSSNTVIYAFSPDARQRLRSGDGQKNLAQLAAQTGGRIFYDGDPEALSADLQAIDANMRSQYRLVYKPADLKPDGSFHHIKLDSPTRGGDITARSGYYAPH